MHWIYILKCEDDNYYIGETTRLFRRLWEHYRGEGGVNTCINKPECVVGIYNAHNIYNFLSYNKYIYELTYECNDDDLKHINYYLKKFDIKGNNNGEEDDDFDNLEAENYIVENMMIHNKYNKDNIKGGKYVREDVDYKFPDDELIKDLPVCYCNLPCDIKKNDETNNLFFRCCKKNFWSDLKDKFDIYDTPCKYYKEYTKDRVFRIKNNKRFQERKQKLKELFKASSWLKGVDIYYSYNYPQRCIGGCYSTSESNKLSYMGKKRNICYDCFINKNETLSNKYSSKKFYTF